MLPAEQESYAASFGTAVAVNGEGDAHKRKMFFIPAEQEKPNKVLFMPLSSITTSPQLFIMSKVIVIFWPGLPQESCFA